MANTFEILTRFLERYDDEVEGRQLAEPADEVKIKLRRLARGELPTAEQGELLGLLNRNPHWIGRLADEVKALRADPG